MSQVYIKRSDGVVIRVDSSSIDLRRFEIVGKKHNSPIYSLKLPPQLFLVKNEIFFGTEPPVFSIFSLVLITLLCFL